MSDWRIEGLKTGVAVVGRLGETLGPGVEDLELGRSFGDAWGATWEFRHADRSENGIRGG